VRVQRLAVHEDGPVRHPVQRFSGTGGLLPTAVSKRDRPVRRRDRMTLPLGPDGPGKRRNH